MNTSRPKAYFSKLALMTAILATLAIAGVLTFPVYNGATTSVQASAAQQAAGGDWPIYGHDQSRTNFNAAETAINRGTVGNLQPRWQAHLGSNGVAPSGAPSAANGKVYVASSVASGPNFFSFDASTGNRIWSAFIGHIEVSCFNVGIGATPAVSGNMVVAGGGDAAYYGLDAST